MKMKHFERHNSFFILLVAILVLSSAFAIGSWFPRAMAAGEVLLEYSRLISDVLTFVTNDYVEEVPPKELITNAIQGMLQELDPHSNLLTPEVAEDLSERTNGQYSGVGIEFDIHGGYLVVLQPIEDGPSERVGIRPGDRIVKINGESAIGITKEEVFRKLRGRKGSQVEVTVEREGIPDLLDFTITRDKIDIKSVRASFMIDDSYGYVMVSNFNRNTARDLQTAMRKLEADGMRGLVLDLRTNPGGLMDQAIDMVDIFIPRDRMIVYTKGRTKPANREYLSKNDNPVDYPVIVMINRYSASASEIVAGALQDWDRALVIGSSRSFGKGLVQSIYQLEQGYRLKLTTAFYYIPSGRSVQVPWKDEEGNNIYAERMERIHRDNDETAGEEEVEVEVEVEKKPYKTKLKKRTVYGGGGVYPDLKVEPNPRVPEWLDKVRRTMLFDFVTTYIADAGIQSVAGFDRDSGWVEALKEFIVERGETVDEEEFEKQMKMIRGLVRAEVGGHLINANERIRILRTDLDEELLEAIKHFPEAQALIAGVRAQAGG
ncbi:S41 family peptidase [candidate division KSB1 bacterium]